MGEYAMGCKTGGRFPTGAGIIVLCHRFHTDSGVRPASYPIGTGDSLRGKSGRGVKLTTQLHLVLRLTIRIKVKVKLSLCLTKHHAMKAYSGSGGIAPRIL
jgi:hypothetical protein